MTSLSNTCASIAAAAREGVRLSPSAWTRQTAAAMEALIASTWAMSSKIGDVVNHGSTAHPPAHFRHASTIFPDLDGRVSDEDHLRALRPAIERLCSAVTPGDTVQCTQDCVFHARSWLFIASIVRGDEETASCDVKAFWIGRNDSRATSKFLGKLHRDDVSLAEFADLVETVVTTRQVAIIGGTTAPLRLAPFPVSVRFRLLLLAFASGVQHERANALADRVIALEDTEPYPVVGAATVRRARMVRWSTSPSGTYAQITVLPACLRVAGLWAFFNTVADVFGAAGEKPDTAALVDYLVASGMIHQAPPRRHPWSPLLSAYLDANTERLAQFTKAVARLVYPNLLTHPVPNTPSKVKCGLGNEWWQVAVVLANNSVTVRASAQSTLAFMDVGDVDDAASETRVARSMGRVFSRRALEAAMRGLMDAVDV